MGIDLCQVGNHKILFEKKSFEKLADEIKTILNNSVLPNSEFLRHAALQSTNLDPKDLRKINSKRDWTYYEEDEYSSFYKNKRIEFYGPFNLELTFEEFKITFWNPPYRYCQWFEWEDQLHIDEWRKYMFHIVALFGGDRVAYLGDYSLHLNEFNYHEGPFEEMEEVLLKKYGKSKTTFKEIVADYENTYFIDQFKDINPS